MATTHAVARQHAFVASTPLMGIANIGAEAGFTFAVRPGTLVLRVFVQTVTAFDGTTNTLTVTDGTTVFANAVDVKTTGAETTANAPKYYATGGTIAVTMAQTGTATAGAAIAGFEYIILGNSNAGIEE